MTPKSVMLGYRGNNDRILTHVFNLAKYIFATKCREGTLNFEQIKKKFHIHITWKKILLKEVQIKV